jgi:hypothetical protein
VAELAPPSGEAIWWGRLDRVLFDRDNRCHGEPFRTLFHHVLWVQENDPQLMEFDDDGRARYRPNP